MVSSVEGRALHKSKNRDASRYTPTGQEFKGQISLAQHDDTGPFCHSEEQSDEESRVMQSSLWKGAALPIRSL